MGTVLVHADSGDVHNAKPVVGLTELVQLEAKFWSIMVNKNGN